MTLNHVKFDEPNNFVVCIHACIEKLILKAVVFYYLSFIQPILILVPVFYVLAIWYSTTTRILKSLKS